MSLRLFVPRDAGAIAVGADEVALALEQAASKRGLGIEIVRTGSRGASAWTASCASSRTAGRPG